MRSFDFLAAAVSALSFLASTVTADIVPFNNDEAYAKGLYGNYSRQTYLSDAEVVGPVANMLIGPHGGVSPSRFIGWAPGGPFLPPAHAMLIDAHSFSTVWQGPAFDRETMGPTVQTCNGTDYLTFWSGAQFDAFKQGNWYIVSWMR